MDVRIGRLANYNNAKKSVLPQRDFMFPSSTGRKVNLAKDSEKSERLIIKDEIRIQNKKWVATEIWLG